MSAVAAPASSSLRRVREPSVLPSYPIRRGISALLTSPSLLAQILSSLLPSPPQWIRSLLYVLLIANVTSFPGLWHVKHLRPLLVCILRAKASTAALFGSGGGTDTTSAKTGRQIRLEVLPIGKDIFEARHYRQERAWPGDCDYMFHLSNSSYAKVLDYSRGTLISTHFFRFLSEGGRMLLGGSTFHFHKEIPIMAPYEVQIRVSGWDNKWIYLIAKFTSPTDPSSHGPTEPVPTSTPGSTGRAPRLSLSRSASNLRGLLSEISRPEHEVRSHSSSAGGRSPKPQPTTNAGAGPGSKQPENETGTASPTYFTSAAQERKTDDTTVYCTAVSRYCFKYGRKTIPPWFIVATSGFGTWASTRTNWDKAEELRGRCARRRAARSNGREDSADGANISKRPWEGMLNAFDSRRDKEKSRSAEAYNQEATGSWCERECWSLSEWEPRRQQGLAHVEKLGGLAPSASASI